MGAALDFLNSNVISAFAGAIAGAVAATWFASYREKRQRLRDEILACNVGIAQCVSIACTFVAIKRQRIRPMHEYYTGQRAQLIVSGLLRLMGDQSPIELCCDVRTLNEVWTPIDALNHTINTRIFSASIPSVLVASLSQATHNHAHFVEGRNSFAERLRRQARDEKMALYFGYQHPGHGTDTSYPDLIDGLVMYTDDCLYYSMLLADVLSVVGNLLRIKHGYGAPIITKVDFAGLDRDLLPDVAQYAECERAYRPKKADSVVTM